MSKMICVKCEVALRPAVNGVYVQEMYNKNKDTYKVWCADIWKCPICGIEVVSGFGNKPCFGNWDDDCEERLQKLINRGAVIIKDRELIHINIDTM